MSVSPAALTLGLVLNFPKTGEIVRARWSPRLSIVHGNSGSIGWGRQCYPRNRAQRLAGRGLRCRCRARRICCRLQSCRSC